MQKKQLQRIIQKLVDGSFIEGRLVESRVVKSIKVLKSLSNTQAIQALGEYLENIRKEERKHTLYIETAVDLTTTQIKKVKKVIEKKVKITKTLVSVNPDILGGFKLKLGDEVWDETLIEKMNQLKEVLGGRSSGSN